jgi:hypothetical protein
MQPVSEQVVSPPRLSPAVFVIALTKLALHLGINAVGAYGYIRDELYYLACSDHLAWGYVDHPPLSIAALWVSRRVVGDSIVALRLLPALSGATAILVTGLLAARLGVSRWGQALACCCTLGAPLVLGMDSLFSMNAFDILAWTLALYLFVSAVDSHDDRTWAGLGVVLGLGLLNKLSVLWLGTGLAAGVLLTPSRRLLLTRGPWLAAAIAAVLFLPHLAWQVSNGYPTLEFIRNAASGKYVALSPWVLMTQQAVFMNPLTFPLWAGGVVYFLLARRMAPHRALSIVYLTVFTILAVNRNSKATYLAPLVPTLFVLGAAWFDRWPVERGRRWAYAVTIVLVLTTGAVLAPLVVAVLPVEASIRYAQTLGVAPSTSENNPLGRLPQHFADMFGWPELVNRVAAVYDALGPDERARCIIVCGNYGEAGAIDFFGRRHGLPPAISGHNNYWLWGPRNATGSVAIVVGGGKEALERVYASVVRADVVVHPYSMPYESDLPIWICRGRRVPFAADWAARKVFN